MKKNIILLHIFLGFLFLSSLAQEIPVTITTDSTYQTIEGFGGFGAKKVWWDNAPYYDQEYLDQVIDTLGCTFIRTQIYWDAEPENDNTDPSVFDWGKFRFDGSTDNGKQFTFIRDLGLKGARLLATVWTPPIWMKGLEEFHGTLWDNPVRRRPSASDLNQNCAWCGGADGCEQVGGWLKPEHYDEFAEFLLAYVLKVKEQTGVDVWGINIQNEPYFANPFESCVIIPDEYADILKTVGERFAAEGITTKLFGPEHMGEVTWGVNNEYIKEILEDELVNPYLSFYAVHSYVDGVATDYGSADGWTTLYEKIVKTHGKELWMTETSDFDKTGYDLAFSMAKSLYLGLKFGHISGWVYWAMADYVIRNNKLTPLGRAFQQFYRFLLPGMVMIRADAADNNLLVLAGKMNDFLVVIIINNSDHDKTVYLDGDVTSADYKLFRTSAGENFKQLENTGLTGIMIKANSINTLTNGNLPTMQEVVSSDRDVVIYPNPANGNILIKNAAGCRFSLHDLQGRCLMTKPLPDKEQRIDLNSFHPGIYMVTITDNNRKLTQKLVITNPY